MVLQWTRLGLAVGVLAACVAVPSSAALLASPRPVDDATTQQLTVAARTMLQRRTEALIQAGATARARELPSEVLGVRISPRLVQAQTEALRDLEARNRAPVEGGPPFTAARTRLKAGRVTRNGDMITLDATEYTEVDYQTPAGRRAMTQSVRRRFEFAAQGGQLVLVGERVVDPAATPINDPDRPQAPPTAHPSPHATPGPR